MENEFLTIKEVAKLLGVTPLTLRNWDKSGKFTATRHPINNYRVYKKQEVLMLLDDMKNGHWKMRSSPSQEREKTSEVKKLNIKHIED